MKRILLTGLAIVLALLTLIAIAVAIFYAWTDWVGARHWQAVEAELRAKGEPATIADIVPRSIPADTNFAAAPIFADIATEPDRTKWRISQIHEFHAAFYRGPEMAMYARHIDPKFSGSEADAARVVLAQTAKWKPLLDEVRMASQRPETEWKIDYYDSPEKYARVLLELSKVLATESKAYLIIGDQESAFRDIELIVNLSTRVSHPPLSITHLIQISVLDIALNLVRLGVEHQAWSDAELSTIQAGLAKLSLRADLIETLRNERAYVNDNIAAANRIPIETGVNLMCAVQKAANAAIGANSDGIEDMERSIPLRVFATIWNLRPSGWAREDQAASSQEFEKLIDVVKAPGAFRPSSMNPTSGSLLTQLLSTVRTPCATKVCSLVVSIVERSLYTQTLLDEVRAACAIERYRLAHGALPPNLDALYPEFLAAIPVDPMSGQPLHYKPGQGDAYILYGVGWNQRDDGGSEQGGRSSEALDWVWKIGNPS